MREAFANEHQDNYFDAEEAGVAAHTAQSNLALDTPAIALHLDHEARPGGAFPFSADHLGTYDNRESYYIPGYGWEQGDVISRERVHTSNIDLWTMVAA